MGLKGCIQLIGFFSVLMPYWTSGTAAAGNETETAAAAESLGIADMVSTLSLFGEDADGSVSGLVESSTVGSLFGIGTSSSSADYFGELQEEQQRQIIDRAYPDLSAKWDDSTVFVCWEQFDDAFSDDRALVRQAISESWEAASALVFEGWQACQENSVGIRISVQDVGPHALKLGKNIDGLKGGLVLNFTYMHWEPGCRKTEKVRNYCTRTTAVHEFGHAIGFSHEQNRPDTPGDCRQKPQGADGDTVEMTPWDPYSVMNYCNIDYLNNGALSDFDRLAVQKIYGTKG